MEGQEGTGEGRAGGEGGWKGRRGRGVEGQEGTGEGRAGGDGEGREGMGMREGFVNM